MYHDRDYLSNTIVINKIGLITHVESIAERLRQARESKGLSQGDVARAAGVTQGTIGNIESGVRRNPRELLAIADAVGVTAEWLKDGKGPMHRGDAQSIPTERALVEHPDSRRLRDAPDVAWRDLGTAMRDVAGWVVVEVATDELAPEICRGDQVVIDPAEPLEPGKPLICQDAEGAWHLRRMRVITGSRWEAYAESGAWAPLPGESLQRALRVVKVIKST